MRPLGMRITFELVLGVVLATSLIIILRLSRRLTEDQRHLDTDAQTLRLLEEALRQKDLQRGSVAAPEEVPAGGIMPEWPRKKWSSSAWIVNWRKIAPPLPPFRPNFQPPTIKASRLRWAPRTACKSSRRMPRPNWMTCKKSLTRRLAESQIARQRAAALETDNAKLKTDAAAVTTRASDVGHIIAGLQDLEHRRDVYLTSILRRYRDITGEFRAMSGMLDTSHDPGSNACSGAVLSRIQNAVSSAEDDMRQLSELNARAQKLEKQLDQK